MKSKISYITKSRSEELEFSEILKIEEALLNSKEAEKKTLLRNYAARSIREVQALVKLYRRDYLQLASMCKFVNTQHSITLPNIKDNLKTIENNLIGNANEIIDIG